MITKFIEKAGRPRRVYVSNRVKKIIYDFINNNYCDKIPFNEIKPDNRLQQDLGMDSLDSREIIYALEENFSISIPDEIANGCETIRDVIDVCDDEAVSNIEAGIRAIHKELKGIRK